MKKQLITIVLSLTMMLTLCGCDKAQKAVTEATEKLTITPTEALSPTETPEGDDVTPAPTETPEVTEVPEDPEEVTPVPTEEAGVTTTPTEGATPTKGTEPTAAASKAPTAGTTKVPTVATTTGSTKAPTKAATKAPTKAATKAPTKSATKAPTKAPKKCNHNDYDCEYRTVTTTYQELVSYAYTEEIPTGRDYIFCNKCEQRFDNVYDWRKHSDDVYESTGDFHGSYRIEWVQTGKNIIEHPAVYETKTKTEQVVTKVTCSECHDVLWREGHGTSFADWANAWAYEHYGW